MPEDGPVEELLERHVEAVVHVVPAPPDERDAIEWAS